jgi:anthranilate 1,2-dioxygenase small subunit
MNVTVPQEQEIHAGARALLAAYTYVLDEGPLTDWPALFTESCLYRITTRQNEERNMPLSIMLCDNHAMLYDRVEAVEKANIFEPHYYRHILSDSRLLRTTSDSIWLETSFICVRTMLDGRMCLFAAGKYVDEIVIEGDRWLFRSKTVVLDSSQVDTLIAKPL